MKRTLGILWIVMFFVPAARAFTKLNPEIHHFFSADVSGGYASLLNWNTTEASAGITPGVGGGGSIGIGYRLFYNSLLFTTGIEGQFYNYTNAIANAQLTIDMIDTEGDPFQMNAQVADCRDVCQVANIAVPLLIGGEYGKFYFLAGAKVLYNVYGNTSSSAYLTTTAEYSDLIGPFSNMEQHELVVNKEVQSGNISARMNWNVLAHLELGGRVGEFSLLSGANVPHPLHRFYVSGYVDIGVLNAFDTNGQQPSVGYTGGTNGNDPIVFYVTPALKSANMAQAYLSNMSVGVKFTFAIEQRDPMRGLIYEPKTKHFHGPGKGDYIKTTNKKSRKTKGEI